MQVRQVIFACIKNYFMVNILVIMGNKIPEADNYTGIDIVSLKYSGSVLFNSFDFFTDNLQTHGNGIQ